MHTYKCRAECSRDIEEFVKYIGRNKLSIYLEDAQKDDIFSDCELVFKSLIDLEHMLGIMNECDDEVGDLHVMCQTLQYIDQYTGERNYDIYKFS